MQNLVVPLLVDQHLVMDLMLLETEMNQLLVHLNHILDDGCGFCIFSFDLLISMFFTCINIFLCFVSVCFLESFVKMTLFWATDYFDDGCGFCIFSFDLLISMFFTCINIFLCFVSVCFLESFVKMTLFWATDYYG